jgi:hypothetical protein
MESFTDCARNETYKLAAIESLIVWDAFRSARLCEVCTITEANERERELEVKRKDNLPLTSLLLHAPDRCRYARYRLRTPCSLSSQSRFAAQRYGESADTSRCEWYSSTFSPLRV